MDTRVLKKCCIIFFITFAYVTKDAGIEALSCYSCGWSSDKTSCETFKSSGNMMELDNSALSGFTGNNCIESAERPTKDVLENRCSKKVCQEPMTACSLWSVSASSKNAEMLFYGCIFDVGKTKMNIDVPASKNSPSVTVEVNFCKKDYCNGGEHSSMSSIFPLTLVIASILLRYNSQFI